MILTVEIPGQRWSVKCWFTSHSTIWRGC